MPEETIRRSVYRAIQFSLGRYNSAIGAIFGGGSSGGGGAGGSWDIGVKKPDTPVTVKPEPENPPSKPDFQLPDLPPINKIRLPPIRIYDPDRDPNLRIIFPELPDRIIPEPQPSPERRVTSDIRESLADRKFGCLLANPLYDTELEFCYYEDESPDTFFGKIIQLITDILEDLITNRVSAGLNNACKIAVALFPLNFVNTTILFLGCEIITDITKYYDRRNLALNSYPISGKINVGGVNFVKCELPDFNEEGEDFTLELSFPECAIPLSMYDQTEGYKVDQLQVIFRSTNWDNDKKKRYFSLPNPRADLDFSNLISAIPLTWQSGKTQIDIFMVLRNFDDGVKPIYKTTIFTPHENRQQVEDFVYMQFKGWLDALTTDVTIKNYQMKQHDNFEIFVGTFKPHRAVQLGWDREQKQWCRKAHWKFS